MFGWDSASRTALAAVRLSLQQSAQRYALPSTTAAARSFGATPRRDEPPHPDLLKAEEVTPDLLLHAKRFAQHFAYSDIPKDALDITFARSSGPGGQVSHGSPASRSSGTLRAVRCGTIEVHVGAGAPSRRQWVPSKPGQSGCM